MEDYKHKGTRGENESNMANFKPIQATPELTGLDALKFIEQVCIEPEKEEIEKNQMLLDLLNKFTN